MFKIPSLPTLPTLPTLSSLTGSTANAGATQLPDGAQSAPEVTPEITQRLFFAQGKPSVTQEVYDDLVHYFKYASTAYAMTPITPSFFTPNGKKLVKKLFNLLTDTNGYIARDDTRKEIVVAFRGSVSPANFVTDFVCKLVAFDSPGVTVPDPTGTKVHLGFQTAWKTVASTVLSTVNQELLAHPGYTLVVTGHSLGGALASLAAVTLKLTYPAVNVRIYTYGQPRTGNPTFASLADSLLGENIFRVVHSLDGVPTMVPELFGFRHHGVEYWALSPHSAANTRICNAAGLYEEDPAGSKSIPSTGINLPHLEYFGIPYITPFFF